MYGPLSSLIHCAVNITVLCFITDSIKKFFNRWKLDGSVILCDMISTVKNVIKWDCTSLGVHSLTVMKALDMFITRKHFSLLTTTTSVS